MKAKAYSDHRIGRSPAAGPAGRHGRSPGNPRPASPLGTALYLPGAASRTTGRPTRTCDLKFGLWDAPSRAAHPDSAPPTGRTSALGRRLFHRAARLWAGLPGGRALASTSRFAAGGPGALTPFHPGPARCRRRRMPWPCPGCGREQNDWSRTWWVATAANRSRWAPWRGVIGRRGRERASEPGCWRTMAVWRGRGEFTAERLGDGPRGPYPNPPAATRPRSGAASHTASGLAVPR